MKTDRRDIERIYGEYAPKLFAASYRILGCVAEAEDVMQDTILKVCTGSANSQAENLGAYLMRSCINRSLDVIRKRKISRDYQQEIIMSSDKSEPRQEKTEDQEEKLRAHIIKLIASLPEGCRQAVTLKLIEGYDYQEIAQITSLNENTIRSNYMRGRKKLADLLKKEGLYDRF